MQKKFKLNGKIERLIPRIGGCLATDKITVEGMQVGYMYREKPDREIDSGWRFFSGTETQSYIDDAKNVMVFDVNTIANFDNSIIPYLDLPYGTYLERIKNTDNFQIVNLSLYEKIYHFLDNIFYKWL